MIHPIDHYHQEVTTYLLMHIPSWNKSMLRGKLGLATHIAPLNFLRLLVVVTGTQWAGSVKKFHFHYL